MLLAPNQIWNAWELMESFNAGELFISITGLSNLGHGIPLGSELIYPAQNHEAMKTKIVYVCGELQRLGLPVSLASAEEVRKILFEEVKPHPEQHPNFGQVMHFDTLALGRYNNFTKELVDRFAAEMRTKLAFTVDSRHAHLLSDDAPLFGEAVESAFPDTQSDIEEASKCLALARPTACVFHLMRAAEGAASILSAHLNGETHQENGEPLHFGGLFNQVSSKIEEMPRGPSKDAWLKLKGFMSSLNRGTRTKVAHPGTVYTERQAERIYDLTKSFMEEAEELLNARRHERA